ncbi:hypothetical protein H6F90_24265 [Trichocoleus sp. FACHB-591]|uniref:hypothetical protein n=1 Tax=Trichocoleus sp. FACHB-591 TaxID=2692872 RepID=UPI00168456AA|nr:hypothetical protein [Trichocoleus sp. FACHB-591]MBD2098187.1 hypothetical protein [Trichocoleus sp. FACHB-591]
MSPVDSSQQMISVTLDAALVQQVDQLTRDRDRAIAEGLRWWCEKQSAQQRLAFAQARHERHERDETGWLV